MAKKIYGLGDIEIDVDNTKQRITITTNHGQKFEVIVGKDNLEVRTISNLSTGICVMPGANNFVRIEEVE